MKNNTVLLLAIVGAVVGVIIVRMFFLNFIQVTGWNLFWKNLFRFNFDQFRLIFKSATFGKCFLGFLLGGAAGAAVGYFLSKR